MKLRSSTATAAFSLGEALVTTAVTSILFAGIFAASVALNRAYKASDAYLATHLQQIRIMDYLARDVRRSFSVTISADKRTVTCIIPNYIVEPGDPEALTDASATGVRRTPVVVGPLIKPVVNYGTRGTRTVVDPSGTLPNGSNTLTSTKANFSASDVGNPIVGPGIQTGTTIASRLSEIQVTLSRPATLSGGKWFTIYGDGNRSVSDAKTTANSTTLTSETAFFTAADVGRMVCGQTTVAGAKITSVSNSTTAVMSLPANATSPASEVTIGGTVVVYAVSNSTITRTENGVLTTIASSTDNLVPETTDVQQANTEYTTTNVTFQPILTSGDDGGKKDWKRSGTAVYATAYLRNRRRGN